MEDKKLASYIDHTLLSSTATKEDIKRICSEAKKYGFATVCINPGNISLAAEELDGSPVKICTVIGFPLGASTTKMKAFETRDALDNGAQEIDMVINIGKLKSKDYQYVLSDIEEVVKTAAPHIVKVIIETSLLNQEEKIIACSLSKVAGAHFVKTSTGFSGGGALVKDVELMKKVVGPEIEVKASGGIRSRKDAEKMIAAGATRLGTSGGPAIIEGHQTKKDY
ncbi:deoxyribose-phosphate aldolase [Bacteriovoracales bacterium]|nr:deoxyribose-phosphate aldolase [Bacteriovoracales bacterium]